MPAAARASIVALLHAMSRNMGPRAAVTVTLLAVLASAALALTLAPLRVAPGAKPTSVAASEPSGDVAKSVKMVGATPRGGDCANQVWPYIEHRCLTRAGDRTWQETVKSDSSQPAGETRQAATTGSAPADAWGSRPADPARERIPATSALQLPPAPADISRLPIPPGAVPPGARRDHLPAQQSAGLGLERAGDEPFAEPRRRSRRHGYRSRAERHWERRPLFTFPF